jgi:AcrR family transcriptional regulator
MTDQITAPAPLGRRESNKADKLRRIEKAARELFLEKGYDETTVREIAARADVGFGTIFAYVTDKAELVYLIRNNEMDALLTEMLPRARAAAALEAQILIVAEAVLRLFRGQSKLSKIIRREMTAHHDGIQSKRFAQTRDRLMGHFVDRIREAQQSGAIKTPEEPALLAQILFALLSWQLRRGETAQGPIPVEDGLDQMTRMMRSVMTGWKA